MGFSYFDIASAFDLDSANVPILVTDEQAEELDNKYPGFCYEGPETCVGSYAPCYYLIDVQGMFALQNSGPISQVAKDVWLKIHGAHKDKHAHMLGGESSAAVRKEAKLAAGARKLEKRTAKEPSKPEQTPECDEAEKVLPYPTPAEQDTFFASKCHRLTHKDGSVTLAELLDNVPFRVKKPQDWQACIHRNTGENKAYYIKDDYVYRA